MAHANKTDANKTWVFVSGENERLNELLRSLGCGSEIASFDVDAFGRKAGDLIARGASSSRGPKPAEAPASGNALIQDRAMTRKGKPETETILVKSA